MPHHFRPVLGIKTFIAGEGVSAGDLNQQGRRHIDFLTNRRPHATAENHFTVNSVANDTWTNIKLDTVKRDTESGFNSSGEYVVQISGWYYVSACVVWANNGTGQRGIRFAINNFPHVSGAVLYNPDSGIACGVGLSRMMPLVEGQILSVQGWQDSGTALATNLAEPEISFMDLLFYSQFFSYTG